MLVLEAGPDETGHPHIRIPAGILRLFKSRFDWDYNSRGEAGLKAGKSVYLCRGKVLGGSSCANVMLYNRGAAEDYEAAYAQIDASSYALTELRFVLLG